LYKSLSDFSAMKVILSAILLIALSIDYSLCATNQSYTWKNVVTGGGGGFVPGIIFNTKQKDLIYARTDIGGAYRWDASTKHWIPLLDMFGSEDWNLYGVDALATDPVDPKKVYLAVGTYTNDWSPSNGEILRSSDSGTTWSRTKLSFKVGGNMPGRSMGERLAIDPNLNSILFFGARSGKGLWKSTDSGATFTHVTAFTADGKYAEKSGDIYLGDTDGEVWIVFDPKTGSSGKATQTIYVGIADKGNSIYKTTNGGTSWAAVAGQPTGYLPHHGVLSSDGILYVTYSNGAGPYDGTKGEVWKYDTNSSKWTNISPVASSSEDDYFGYGGLSVDAQKPSTVMIAALNSWWPDTIFWRSTDAGATWSRIWEWASYPSKTVRYSIDVSGAPWLNFGVTNPTEPEPAVKLGWMVGSLAIDPHDSNKMLYGTGATIFASHDLTNWDKNTSIHITVEAAGIEETSVLQVISPSKGAVLYSAMGDVSGFRHDSLTTAPKSMWSVPFAGSFSDIDYAELKPDIMVLVGYGKPTADPPIRSSAFSNNGGTSWSAANNDPSGMSEGGGNVAVAADGSHTVWSPPNGGVFYTADSGNSWTKSSGIGAQGRVASDRVNPKKFYGFASSTFWVSTDGGASFTATAKTLGDSGKFKAAPGKEGEIWFAAGKNGLHHSKDSGTSFTKVTGVTTANVVGFGKEKSGASYPSIYIEGVVDSVTGVYRSDDSGATWVHINDATHQYGSVQCITGDSRTYGRVYFGTNGRGIIYGDPK